MWVVLGCCVLFSHFNEHSLISKNGNCHCYHEVLPSAMWQVWTLLILVYSQGKKGKLWLAGLSAYYCDGLELVLFCGFWVTPVYMCNRGAHGSSVRSDYMRSWSRRKLLTAVKVEGDSLVGWQGRRYEDGDPSWFLIPSWWQGRGCWRMGRQGACSFLWHSPRVEHVMSWGAVWSCKSGLSCLSLHTAAFWVDWWRLSLRWIHQDIILNLCFYMVTESWRVVIFCFSSVPVVVITGIANCRDCLLRQ